MDAHVRRQTQFAVSRTKIFIRFTANRMMCDLEILFYVLCVNQFLSADIEKSVEHNRKSNRRQCDFRAIYFRSPRSGYPAWWWSPLAWEKWMKTNRMYFDAKAKQQIPIEIFPAMDTFMDAIGSGSFANLYIRSISGTDESRPRTIFGFYLSFDFFCVWKYFARTYIVVDKFPYGISCVAADSLSYNITRRT